MKNYKQIAIDLSLMVKVLSICYKNYSETKDPKIREGVENEINKMVTLVEPILSELNPVELSNIQRDILQDSDETILARVRKENKR